MFIKLNEDEAADKSRAKTAQVLVSHCTELQTEGLSHRALFSVVGPKSDMQDGDCNSVSGLTCIHDFKV